MVIVSKYELIENPLNSVFGQELGADSVPLL
jgi:hypothetical protein